MAVFLQHSMFIKIGSLVHLMRTRENKTHSHTQKNLAQFKNSLIIHLKSLHGIIHNILFYLLISITLFCCNKEGSLENLKLFHCALPWMNSPTSSSMSLSLSLQDSTLEAKSKCQFSPLALMHSHLCSKEVVMVIFFQVGLVF